MNWRTIKQYGDLLTEQDWNEMVQYIINHKLQHQKGGEQVIDHNQLQNYDIEEHRKIVFNALLETVDIEF